MTDNTNLHGCYLITEIDSRTGKTNKIWRFENMLTAINQTIRTQMLLGTFSGSLNDLAIKYFAFGVGDTSPTTNDTKLENEVYRKQVTQLTNPSLGTVQSVVSLGSVECNYKIKEIGVFCGSSATIEPNTGTLLSRVLFSFDKNSNIVLNIVRNDICTIN